MENLEIYDKLKSVPEEYLKPITAGRLKGMSDIKPQWRIQRMTEVFGICGIGWKVSNVSFHYQTYGDECVCNCRIDLYVRQNGEWSEGIPGTGGSKYSTMEKNGVYISDEAEKMAYTDALSVAMKMIGVASDVYMGLGNESKYSKPSNNTPKQQTTLQYTMTLKDVEQWNGRIYPGNAVYVNGDKKTVSDEQIKKLEAHEKFVPLPPKD